jgi:hypothetical protein
MGKYTEALDPNNPHLGGNYIEMNQHTHCPKAWQYVINKHNIKSVLDIGSGRGHAAKWFNDQGLKSYAIEGMEENCQLAVHPTECVDLTKKTYSVDVDLVNCVEVVEHVEEKYLENLLTALCCGKYIFMTHGRPKQRGHHHVNNQPTEYWIKHLGARGFKLLDEDSAEIKRLAKEEGATHIIDTGMLFVKV